MRNMQSPVNSLKPNCVVLLGPTAVGKTSLGVQLAAEYGWEIISADSRQVYKGLDLGSGKDLSEYSAGSKKIPYHLIDITTLASEYNVFSYQQDFYSLFKTMRSEGKMPFIVGGTGMYVDSVVRGYDFVPVEENKDLRAELDKLSLEELGKKLLELRPNLHNKSDLLIRERVVRAIEIETFRQSPECAELKKRTGPRPQIDSFVIGTTLERDVLRQNIKLRLIERIEAGMIEEVSSLHEQGFSWERLEKLGLEYRYVSLFLEGKIDSVQTMTDELYHAVCQFAKRQETWFRGMERKGVKINWLPRTSDRKARFDAARQLIEDNVL